MNSKVINGRATTILRAARRPRRSMVVVLAMFALLVMTGAPLALAGPALAAQRCALAPTLRTGEARQQPPRKRRRHDQDALRSDWPGDTDRRGSTNTASRHLAGQLYAFGENNYGQLGIATNSETGNPNRRRSSTLPATAVTQIAAGANSQPRVTSTGQLYAFGETSRAAGEPTNNGTANSNP